MRCSPSNPMASSRYRWQHYVWLAICLLSFSGCGKAEKSEEAASSEDASHHAVVVNVELVERRKIGKTVTAIGRCESLPENLALVTPVIEGRVAELLAK